MPTNLLQFNYFSRKPVEQAMMKFARKFEKNQTVLDIGCGNKPYADLFDCKYVGLDPFDKEKADIVAFAWNMPVKENCFDGIIMNQSLEHIKRIPETILEIKRTLKPGGTAIITAPQTMKNHGITSLSEKEEINNFDKNKTVYWRHDYYRFTKYGLIYMFQDFKILEITETSGYFSTILQLLNYFLYSIGGKLFIPIYLLNNIIGLLLDKMMCRLGASRFTTFKKFYDLIYSSLTLNYILIVKKIDAGKKIF